MPILSIILRINMITSSSMNGNSIQWIIKLVPNHCMIDKINITQAIEQLEIEFFSCDVE